MMAFGARAALLAVPLLSLAGSPALAQTPTKPFPQTLPTYGTGTILANRHIRAEMNDHVRAFYDLWKQKYLVDAGLNASGQRMYRIAFGAPGTPRHASTVSEGQGFGLTIVALMAGHDPEARAIVDGLYRFARRYPSGIEPRLMTWKVTNGAPDGGNSSAFDGDADIAFGLLIAAKQWPASAGGLNYASAATTILSGLTVRTLGLNSRLPMLGDWVQPAGTPYNQYTHRSSDLMPAAFRAFYLHTRVAAWDYAMTSARNTIINLQLSYAPNVYVLPDFMQPISTTNKTRRPANPNFLEGPHDGAYNYNANRVPLRIGLDALFNRSSTSITIARRLSQWAMTTTAGNPLTFKSGYQLNGQPIAGRDYLSTAFVAPLGVAAMVTPAQQVWLNNIYDVTRQTQQDYYEDTLALLSMLIMTGNFWNPSL